MSLWKVQLWLKVGSGLECSRALSVNKNDTLTEELLSQGSDTCYTLITVLALLCFMNAHKHTLTLRVLPNIHSADVTSANKFDGFQLKHVATLHYHLTNFLHRCTNILEQWGGTADLVIMYNIWSWEARVRWYPELIWTGVWSCGGAS